MDFLGVTSFRPGSPLPPGGGGCAGRVTQLPCVRLGMGRAVRKTAPSELQMSKVFWWAVIQQPHFFHDMRIPLRLCVTVTMFDATVASKSLLLFVAILVK